MFPFNRLFSVVRTVCLVTQSYVAAALNNSFTILKRVEREKSGKHSEQ